MLRGQLYIFASYYLSPMSRNLLFEESTVQILAVNQEEICLQHSVGKCC